MTQACQQEKCGLLHFSCNSLPCRLLDGLSYSSGPMPSAKRVGSRIKEWRLRRELTQEELGDKIGSDGPRVGRLEKGSENPTLETLDKLASALKVDVSDLFRPRPEDAGHEDRPRERSQVLDQILSELDQEYPAADSWEGDIHKAIAALNRALRRGRDSGTVNRAPKTARS